MSAHSFRKPIPRHLQSGFSLIELMVGITIALIVTLAIFNVLTVSESRKRVTTGVNDINQSGAFGAYVLDRAIRSAGSGFTNQRVSGRPVAFEGCLLAIERSGVALSPNAAAFPAPFAGVSTTAVLAPVIIDQGTDSDIITVMSGTSGASEVGTAVRGAIVGQVGVVNTFSFRANDLVLFAHEYPAEAARPCTLSQVANGFTEPATVAPQANETLPLDGRFRPAAGTVNINTGDTALGLGGGPAPAADTSLNPPQFKMYGVGANQTLVALDLLNISGTANGDRAEQVAEGVLEMRAIYGLDTNDDNVLDSWQEPTGAWSGATLRNGSAASANNLRQIVAVRIALVMRTTLPELDKTVPATTEFTNTYTLYSDLPSGSPTRTLTYTTGNAQRYRYRVIESTIPLRNSLL